MLLSSSGKEQQRAQQALSLGWSSYQVLLLEHHASRGDHLDGWSTYLEQLHSWWNLEQRHIAFRAGNYIGILTGRPYGERELSELRERLLDHSASSEVWYAAAGMEVDELEQIHDSYAEALDLLEQRFWFGANGIAVSKSENYGHEPESVEQSCPPSPQANEWADRLYYAVDIRSLEAAERVLSELMSVCQLAGLAERDTKSLSSHVLSLALSRLPGSVAGSGPAVQACLALIPELYSAPTATSLIHLMLGGLEELLQSINGVSHESVMKQMTDFIRRHYSDNLKLELLAEVFNYNSAYLGKMFKTYTGESFNHFLDGVRLDHAKALLAQGMKVHKVASMVGYANVDYFHSKFKKYTGISPSAYREQMGNEQQH